MRLLQIMLKLFKAVVKLTLIFVILWCVFQYSILRVSIVSQRDYNYINDSNVTMSLVMNLDVVNILIWSKDDNDFDSLQSGQDAFIKSKCDNINCYITSDRNMLGKDYSLFDAILINAKDAYDLPQKRSSHQKFVFATRDLDTDRGVCDKVFDNFFNLTYTPKLDSDAVWSYFPIVVEYEEANLATEIILDTQMNKSRNMRLTRIGSKLYTAIYMKSNCNTNDVVNPISNIVKELQRFYLDVKINCAEECLKNKECKENLSKYYFYFIVEDQTDVRRVVADTLAAIRYNTVPVILGPTDYSKHLPPNSFINAWNLGPRNTAIKMAKLIGNDTAYSSYFTWKSSPVYRANLSSECRLCELLNRKETKTYRWLRDWWNPAQSRCPEDWVITE